MMTCQNAACDRAARKRGFCNTHYEAARLRGGLPVREHDAATRFWGRVDKSDGCWEWTGAKASGYGRVSWRGKVTAAHRVAYELLVGPIPAGLDLDHLCRNRACVRPAHLEPVTRQVNLLRGETIPAELAARTHCRHGHEFTPENTYEWHGARYCRTCRDETEARRGRPPVQDLIQFACVMCGTPVEMIRRVGRTPNVCSDACRKDRSRQAAREFQQRKRASQSR